MKKIIKGYHNFLRERLNNDKFVFTVELIYVLFCLGSCIYFSVMGRTQNAVMSFCFPVLVLIVNLIEWKIDLRCGGLFYVFFFFMCSSNVLGNGYGLYDKLFPYFDKIMHTLSGIVCTCFGYAVMKKITGGDAGKKFAYCLFFGLLFAMAIASIWEVYEYFVSEVLHDDMQTNYIVNTLDYENYIYQTYLYYTDGSFEVIDGYIDVGLFDTLQDITVCLCGSALTIVLLVIDNYCFGKAINRLLVPVVLKSGDEDKISELDKQLAENIKTI